MSYIYDKSSNLTGVPSIIKEQIKKHRQYNALRNLENKIKNKLQRNFTGIRKAFLTLDVDNLGYVRCEELAKLIKYATDSV